MVDHRHQGRPRFVRMTSICASIASASRKLLSENLALATEAVL